MTKKISAFIERPVFPLASYIPAWKGIVRATNRRGYKGVNGIFRAGAKPAHPWIGICRTRKKGN